jgi:phosphoribosylglycinamide formyltransferase-1
MRLGILVSGRGSNLEAVLTAVDAGQLAGVEPVLVLSNRHGIRALSVAKRHDVAAAVLAGRDFADLASRDAAMGQRLTTARCDLALLAGYDQLLRPSYFAAFGGRTINIHPSLLPRHGGPGMMGLAVHAAVLAAGDRETGVTIHEVTIELDRGAPIEQVTVPVFEHDTAERLAERVLAVEHLALVRVLSQLSASMTAAPRA